MRNFYKKLGSILYVIFLPLIRPVINHTERVSVVVIYNKKVLLVKNWLARDSWRFPGGGIKKDESYLHAAAREIKEELRIVTTENRFEILGQLTALRDGFTYPYTLLVYKIDIHPKVLHDQYEIIAYEWFDKLPKNYDPELEEIFDLLKKRRLI